MPRLIWTPEALHDVHRLYRFLAEADLDAAQRAADTIRDGVQILAEHPRAGRPVEHMAPEFREWIIEFGGSGYLVLYHYDGESAVNLAVRHQRELDY